MSKLFNNGDYVLLEDCKAFDEEYGLAKDTTMWAVARKMEGGEPHPFFVALRDPDACIMVNTGSVVVRGHLYKNTYATKLTVEDVLYRSEDGMTLNELSKIPGAFDEGKEYECVWTNEYSPAAEGGIYKGEGKGIVICGLAWWRGDDSRFKPVTPVTKWTPSVGEGAVFQDNVCMVEHIKDDLAWISRNKDNKLVDMSLLKPIDKEREDLIKKVVDLSESLDACYSSRDFAIELYNAGMLKD